MALSFRKLNPFRKKSHPKPMTEKQFEKVKANIPLMDIKQIEAEITRLTKLSKSRPLNEQELVLFNLLFKEKPRKQYWEK
ncbi:MAG: hypothetical protein J4224_00470 [Candidatus Diapherotrites archaeon]|uniref:Uncharacterized protein n=1 Tax=Candidatus Iainarchaeum sp. TaxID=3101447 RepID=A0A7J4IT71_9ARCH|nr:MAG: hypothetical protein QT03_C0001G0460 [archaeon GW2011_AR10]MBS3058882.1 hypothetical protein [Candidatus Diapherotrites archaeon]HIH08718.1 hypothetical protein [Candidatus Diapherotrites archaeon]